MSYFRIKIISERKTEMSLTSRSKQNCSCSKNDTVTIITHSRILKWLTKMHIFNPNLCGKG